MRVLRAAEKVAVSMKAEKQAVQNSMGKLVVTNGDRDRGPSIVQCAVGGKLANSKVVTLADSDGNRLFGQISKRATLGADFESENVLTFVVPEMQPNQKIEYQILNDALNPPRTFTWHDDGSTQAELQIGDVSVLKYMYEEVDDSSKQRRQETYKPYHHVFSHDGKTRLTKGPGGLFPHHRGIFFGYNRISYDGKKADVWHCKNGESQIHTGNLARESGPVFGRHANVIDWNGQDGNAFARETRQLTAFKIGSNTMIQFDVRLDSLGEEISLRGDPQHAGVQFRASQSVPDKTKMKTFYIRPDGKAEPGSFRNWSNKKDESEINRAHVDLPWHAVSLFIDDQQYSICNIGHPENPKPARFSERDYGRFGSYFEYDLTPESPLVAKYRFWIQDGEIEIESANKLMNDFSNPLNCSVDLK